MSLRLPRLPLARLAACALLTFAACQGTAPRVAPTPPPSPVAARPAPVAARVLLLSLDGAAGDVLHHLYAEGKLDAGGFARFFREGQVAEAIVPVNPTLTSSNHISLATGYPASATGIVSNRFHWPGTPCCTVVSGFDASIATETLWEAARRQGKRVGCVTWPGVDGKDDRRRADWGMIYAQPDRPSALVNLGRRDWAPAEIPRGTAFAPSYAPVLVAHVKLPGSRPQGDEGLDLFALDRADDGVVRYDRLLVRAPGTPEQTLATGQWLHLLSPAPAAAPGAPEGTPAGLWIKVLAIDPGLASVRLYFGSANHTRAYPEGFAAALTAAGLAWPGAPDDRRLQASWQGQQGIDLDTFVEQAERFAGFFGGSLRVAAARPDWDLLLGYSPVIDEAGHTLSLVDPRQPGFSPELAQACARGRLRVWQAVDRELARLLSEVDLATTRVLVVSDHGMAPVHTLLYPNVLLLGKGYLAVDEQGTVLPQKTTVVAVSDGGLSHLYLGPRAGADPARQEKLLADLRALFEGFTVDGVHPFARVLTRREAAAVGLDHPNSGDLILFANEGYLFDDGADRRIARAVAPTQVYGTHGYLNTNADMHGIYMVLGAGVLPGTSSAVPSTEVAGRVAEWLGIEKPRPLP
ncbi:MAG TPA: alkaline phosphatase family protein [Thermoanaerobaculia bacterium]|nr:alkaline phosphatase family protein [Thermoanaerobaculia bacterium]